MPVQQHLHQEHPDGLRQLLRCCQEREISSGGFHLRRHHLHRQEDGIRCQPYRKHHSEGSEYYSSRKEQRIEDHRRCRWVEITHTFYRK